MFTLIDAGTGCQKPGTRNAQPGPSQDRSPGLVFKLCERVSRNGSLAVGSRAHDPVHDPRHEGRLSNAMSAGYRHADGGHSVDSVEAALAYLVSQVFQE